MVRTLRGGSDVETLLTTPICERCYQDAISVPSAGSGLPTVRHMSRDGLGLVTLDRRQAAMARELDDIDDLDVTLLV